MLKNTCNINMLASMTNDSLVCSDRGVCDWPSGMCKCFKNCTGIDCNTQNALSMGRWCLGRVVHLYSSG